MRDGARGSLAMLEGLGGQVSPSLAPHSIYMVSEESLAFIAALSAEHDAPVQIHLSETAPEVEDCIAATGLRPAAYLDRLGLLTERTLLAHGVWLDEDELALVAARGATVVSNPAANMKLAVGKVFPYPPARAAGVRVGLGTDGAGSNDSLDLLAELKLFALAQRHAAADATAPGRSPPAPPRPCSAPPRSRSAPPPTSCCSTRPPPSWRSASSPPTSSTRRPAPRSTLSSSPAAS
jgi:cytosine/adenosine deaminase-related metal-dependent hydrolase